ncbi:MAG: cytochrome c family protein [Alphaproteobacteria bacterium]|nr:cytochrome c family protein [Alphaproteobacteria bacterium]
MTARILLVGAALAVSLLSVGPALAAGDAAKGKKVFAKCRACHKVDKPKNGVGPTLNGLFGRTAGTVEKYKYSKAMKAKGEEGLVWSEEILAEYIVKPQTYVKGTKMTFRGLKKPEDIQNLIAYLKASGA